MEDRRTDVGVEVVLRLRVATLDGAAIPRVFMFTKGRRCELDQDVLPDDVVHVSEVLIRELEASRGHRLANNTLQVRVVVPCRRRRGEKACSVSLTTRQWLLGQK